ncbi:hypothetical protein FRX31_019841 [Thalictrum thalictroides]|uniref:Uncharacterized protein n=1 Tax=Thalictrum thalictroides TaxID=46969 RepID=A0A7J6VZN5_THATH|nr:hypothetical protein FRX31_019841 [Thalictrum thalictroides]
MENYVDKATYNADVEFWHARITFVVQRSLCEGQFEAFQDFHAGVEDLCHALIGAIKRIRDQMAVFFPPPPLRMKRMNWIQFASWSEYGHGDGVEEECSTWGYYGSQCVKICPDCKAATVINPNEKAA